MFSDILITSDFDHTLTAKDGTIPARNLEAIEYFMAHGGTFTVNTGRSLPMSQIVMDQVPMNAPLIAYNGGACYDAAAKKLVFCQEIDLPMAQTMEKMEEMFPELVTEVEGLEAHYLFKENPMWNDFCANNRCNAQQASFQDDLGPFLKFCVMGPMHDNTVAGLYRSTAEEAAYFDLVEAKVRQAFGSHTAVYRAAARIVDVHPKHASKLLAARQLQGLLKKKLLVCIGDGENDVSMLQGADYGFCPSDARVASRFENLCSCNEGALADLIFRKLPEILGKMA